MLALGCWISSYIVWAAVLGRSPGLFFRRIYNGWIFLTTQADTPEVRCVEHICTDLCCPKMIQKMIKINGSVLFKCIVVPLCRNRFYRHFKFTNFDKPDIPFTTRTGFCWVMPWGERRPWRKYMMVMKDGITMDNTIELQIFWMGSCHVMPQILNIGWGWDSTIFWPNPVISVIRQGVIPETVGDLVIPWCWATLDGNIWRWPLLKILVWAK